MKNTIFENVLGVILSLLCFVGLMVQESERGTLMVAESLLYACLTWGFGFACVFFLMEIVIGIAEDMGYLD